MKANTIQYEEISLERLLAARDERFRIQTRLRNENPEATLVVLTVVMPGKYKRTYETIAIAREACKAIERALEGRIELFEHRNLPTGYEAYVLTDIPRYEVKQLMCQIEEDHPLGRLFDIDVFEEDGTPISRIKAGQPARKCLICGKEARVCMRERNHSYEELIAHICKLVSDYESRI